MYSSSRFQRPATVVAVLTVVLVTVAAASAQLHARLIASGFSAPIAFVQDPADPTVQMVVEQGGRIRVLKNGTVQATDFLNVSSLLPAAPLSERGLLGMAFSPHFTTDGRFYISYTNTNGDSVISRYVVSADPLQADVSSRFDLVWDVQGHAYISQPYANHNGGNIAFGPDNYLYVGFGDGGSGNDPQNRAQDPTTLLGKMLRIDVNVSGADTEGYNVPADNPFVGVSGVRPEIWALGLRNPWRWSFDTAGTGGTGAMVIGDVGQDAWEEIDYAPPAAAGHNYGWRVREGPQANIATPPAWSSPLRDPIWSYSHSDGNSVIGGFVYRGTALGSAYQGRYFFADYGRSRVWSLSLSLDPTTHEATAGFYLEHTADLNVASPSSFGVDSQGEIYIVTYGGSVYRIELAPGPTAGDCTTPDPFGNVGGGTCLGGTWHSPRHTGDFNVDGSSDLLFWNYSTGELYAWYMSGITFAGGNYLTGIPHNAAAQVGAVADFTGDGKLDVLMQDHADWSVHLFAMNGLTKTNEQIFNAAPPWSVVASGDFNGDGYPDIVWENFQTGQFYVWYMQPFSGVSTFIGGGYLEDSAHAIITLGSTAWRIAGAGDFNNDGRTDLVWENDGSGAIKISYLGLPANNMKGPFVVAEGPLGAGVTNPSWKIRAVADFNGDGRPDVIWQHFSTADLYAWFMSGPQATFGSYLSPAQVNPVWQVGGPK